MLGSARPPESAPPTATPLLDEDDFRGRSYRHLLKKLALSISVYGAGILAVRFGSLLLVPIYWRFLLPADFGILAGTAIVTSVSAALLGLAIPQAIIRFYASWPLEERAGRVGSAWAIDWLTTFVFGGALVLASGPLLHGLFRAIPVDPYLRLGIVIGALTSLSASPLAVLRIEGKDKQYVALSIASFLIQTVLTLVFVVYFGMGAVGVLDGQLWTAVVLIPVYTLIMFRRARPVIVPKYAREAVAYSFPLVPGSIVESITPVTDRFVLEKYVSLSALGIYGLADTFAGIVRTVSVAIKSAWVPFQFRLVSGNDDAKRIMARSAEQMTLAIFTVAFSLAVLARDFVIALNRPAYFSVATYMVPLLLSYVFNGLQPIFATNFLIPRKTSYAWATALTHLVVSLASALLLVPRIGVMGAVVASVLGYTSRFGVGFYLSQRSYPIVYRWKSLGVVTLGALLGYLLSTYLPAAPSLAGAVLRGFLVLLFFPTMFLYLIGHTARSAALGRFSR